MVGINQFAVLIWRDHELCPLYAQQDAYCIVRFI